MKHEIFRTRYWLPIIIAVGCPLLVSGCPTTGKNEPPATTATQIPAYIENSPLAGNEQIQVIVHSISPVSDGWLEYKVTISNRSGVLLKNVRAQVHNPTGVWIDPAESGDELNKQPDLATSIGVQTGIAGAGMALTYAGIPFVGAIAQLGYSFHELSEYDETIDLIEYHADHNLQYATIYIDGQVQGSFFFPNVETDDFRFLYVIEDREYALQFSEGMNDDLDAEESGGNLKNLPLPERVLLVQEELRRRGYNPGTPDGILGPRTTAAVKAFQSDVGIEVTGEVDDRLLAALGLI